MMGTLVWKLFRDVRLALVIVMILLAAFQCRWAKSTQRILAELLPELLKVMTLSRLTGIVFEGSGKLLQTLLGGESIRMDSALDMISIGYVHPLVQTIFCIWAIGRAAGAISGEIDRGTMELLLAQPIPRWRIILAHLWVDILVIPLFCLSLWTGNWLGTWLVDMQQLGAARYSSQFVDPRILAPALWNVGALLFAVSGYTMWLSAGGRFRGRVMGLAVLVTLLQFLVNLVGQMWDAMAPLRQFTVFYYYQPQQIILSDRWTIEVGKFWNSEVLGHVPVIGVLLAVGIVGYALALWTFCRRDLPAPL
jgi:beta-exotoxin I transport system permease protein